MTNLKFNNSPFEGTLNNCVDTLFSELPVMFKQDFNQTGMKGLVPVNVKETADSYILDIVAPGFEKTDFKINLDQHLLTISAEKNIEKKETTDKQIRNEYKFRSFKRSFTIDEKTDATKIEASYINGVLTLNLPKKVEVKQTATEIAIK